MTKIDDDDARQGRKGTPVLMILIVALALCVVAFVGVQFYGASEPDSKLNDASQTSSEPAPAANASQNETGDVVQPGANGVTGTNTGSN